MNDNELREWAVTGRIDGETQEQAMQRLGREIAERLAENKRLLSEISLMKMQSATEALAWSLGQMWVSADEQLPDDRTYCLVIASDDDSAVGHYQLANYTKQYGWAFSDDSIDRFYMKVTHWMPLPEPPEVK